MMYNMEISFLWLLTIVLFILKVTSLVAMSWWWVAAPFLISIIFAAVMVLIVGKTVKSLWTFSKHNNVIHR